MTDAGPRVLISCGEASGDAYAAALVRALRERAPGLEVTGFGGPALAAEGATLAGTYDGMSVTGLTEALGVVRRSWQMLGRIEGQARDRRPDVFVAVDFPDFNFRLLPRMRALGVPIVYYISPQLWAWRAGRMATIKRYVDRMLTIFPFEAPLYEQAGVPVTFVGHPLIELARPTEPRDAFLAAAGVDPSRRVVALLPGSRANEVHRVLPTLLAAVPAIAAAAPDVSFVIPRAPGLPDTVFDGAKAAGAPVCLVPGRADDVLAAAEVALVASGTATVQTALHDTPMVIVYRVTPLTYAIGRRLVGVSTFGMVNLIAGRRVVTELIQHDFTPEAVAAEAIALLTDPSRAARMRADLAAVRARLGGGGASGRAAEAVLAVAQAARAR